jgi:hypothetical protein
MRHEKQTITTFHDEGEQAHESVQRWEEPTMKLADEYDSSLGAFLARPLRIRQFIWDPGLSFSVKLNPWEEFFRNPRIINRIANYRYIRCNLHVKLVVNGNKFYWGRILFAYRPYTVLDDLPFESTASNPQLVSHSQSPHFYINPTDSSGGEMEIPYFSPYNAMDIVNGDWTDMGDIVMRSFGNLEHASNSTVPVEMSLFVWATDVTLTMPTGDEPIDLVAQSGDEYGKSPISSTATAVAAAAGKLSDVPVIGRYARATEVAASATATVAKAFGYSRPNDIDTIHSFKPVYVGNLANTNVPDTCQKLALDAKQEITIDPLVTGADQGDKGGITAIAKKEAFLTSFDWDPSFVQDATIGRIRVTPMLFGVSGLRIYPTPACWVSCPFTYWRGSMKLRLQVVASSFHRGRLLVRWDPNRSPRSPVETNINYQWIVDIGEQQDTTLSIGWGARTPYLQCEPIIDGGSSSAKFGLSVTPDPRYDNGCIAITVLNGLTEVQNSAPVKILVSVAMDDDFEVACPTDSTLATASFWEAQSSDDNGAVASEKTEEDTKVGSMQMSPQLPLVYMGEKVTSIYQLMKRYTYLGSSSSGVNGNGANVFFKLINSDFPCYRGYDPNGKHSTGTAVNYNFVHMTPINWFTPGYAARRGSMKRKYMNGNTLISSAPDTKSYLKIERQPHVDGQFPQPTGLVWNPSNSLSTNAQIGITQRSSGWTGATLSDVSNNQCVEAELPWYSLLRFAGARNLNVNVSAEGNRQHKLETVFNSATNRGKVYDEYVAAGEDFSLSFFVSAPPFYIVPTPSA